MIDSECNKNGIDTKSSLLNIKEFWLILLVMCSSLAGVYNEKYLRNKYSHIPVLIQGIHYYFYGILFNLIAFIIISNIINDIEIKSFTKGWNLKIFWIIVLLNAMIGLCYAFVFKLLGALNQNIIKSSAVIVVFFLEMLLFDHEFVLNTFCAILIIIVAILLWRQV